MTTAATMLASQRAETAWVLEIEGVAFVLTDHSDLSGIGTAFGATAKGGLDRPAPITRRLNLLRPEIDPLAMSIRALDLDGSLVDLFAVANTAAVVQYLAADADRDDTTLTLGSTTGLSSPVHVGRERLTFSGTTATTLTGCTRGTRPWGGKAAWGHTHRIGSEEAGGLGPEVATKPRVHRGRGVMLWQTAKDESGSWIVKADASLEVAGVMTKPWKFSTRDGYWTTEISSVESLIEEQVLRNQFTAVLGEGFYLLDDVDVLLTENNLTDGTVSSDTITIAAGHYTHDELLAAINTEFAAATLTFDWGIYNFAGADGVRVAVTAVAYPGADGDLVEITFGVENTIAGNFLLRFLGFTAVELTAQNLISSVQPEVTILGNEPPIRQAWFPWQTTLPVTRIQGEWANQNTTDYPQAGGPSEGAIQVGDFSADRIWLVNYDDAGTFTRVATVKLSQVVADGPIPIHPGPGLDEIVTYVGGELAQIQVRQVWVAKRSASSIILRLLKSTGTTSYNDSDDIWPATMGCAIPSTLIDSESIRAISNLVGPAALQSVVILEPTSAAEIVETIMATLGFHIVWRNNKLTAIVPTTLQGLTPTWTLDTTNTGSDHFTEVDDGSDLIVNSLKLKCNRNPLSDDEYGREENYIHEPSISEHGTNAFEVEARFLYDSDGSRAQAWRLHVAAPAIAYFGRAITRCKRSGAPGLMGMAVGDIVSFTDPDVPNMQTGAYGATAVKAWVTSVTKDPEADELTDIELLIPLSKAYPWAPSGMLDYDRGDKGYDAGNLRLYLRGHEFSLSGESKDALSFRANDKARVVEVDPATAASPATHLVTITSVDTGGDYVVLSGTLTAFDDTKRYYLVLDDYSTVIASNSNRAIGGTDSVGFIADDADHTVLNLSPAVLFQWGSGLSAPSTSSPSGDDYYRRPYSVSDDDGEPNSVSLARDLAKSSNVLYKHVVRQHPISSQYTSDRSITGTTYGYIGCWCVPCPPGAEQITITVYGKVQGAANEKAYFRATASQVRPGGTVAAPTFPADINQVEDFTQSTTLAAVTLTLTLQPGPDRVGYVTLEAKGENVATVGIVRGVSGTLVAPSLAA